MTDTVASLGAPVLGALSATPHGLLIAGGALVMLTVILGLCGQLPSPVWLMLGLGLVSASAVIGLIEVDARNAAEEALRRETAHEEEAAWCAATARLPVGTVIAAAETPRTRVIEVPWDSETLWSYDELRAGGCGRERRPLTASAKRTPCFSLSPCACDAAPDKAAASQPSALPQNACSMSAAPSASSPRSGTGLPPA